MTDRAAPPSAEEALSGLAEIVQAVTDTPADQVTSGRSFADDLGVDSLAMIEVVVGAEERFGVRIPDEEVRGLRTVDDAVGLIARRAQGA